MGRSVAEILYDSNYEKENYFMTAPKMTLEEIQELLDEGVNPFDIFYWGQPCGPEDLQLHKKVWDSGGFKIPEVVANDLDIFLEMHNSLIEEMRAFCVQDGSEVIDLAPSDIEEWKYWQEQQWAQAEQQARDLSVERKLELEYQKELDLNPWENLPDAPEWESPTNTRELGKKGVIDLGEPITLSDGRLIDLSDERLRGALEKNNYSELLEMLYGDNIIYQQHGPELEHILKSLGDEHSLAKVWAKEVVKHNNEVVDNLLVNNPSELLKKFFGPNPIGQEDIEKLPDVFETLGHGYSPEVWDPHIRQHNENVLVKLRGDEEPRLKAELEELQKKEPMFSPDEYEPREKISEAKLGRVQEEQEEIARRLDGSSQAFAETGLPDTEIIQAGDGGIKLGVSQEDDLSLPESERGFPGVGGERDRGYSYSSDSSESLFPPNSEWASRGGGGELDSRSAYSSDSLFPSGPERASREGPVELDWRAIHTEDSLFLGVEDELDLRSWYSNPLLDYPEAEGDLDAHLYQLLTNPLDKGSSPEYVDEVSASERRSLSSEGQLSGFGGGEGDGGIELGVSQGDDLFLPDSDWGPEGVGDEAKNIRSPWENLPEAEAPEWKPRTKELKNGDIIDLNKPVILSDGRLIDLRDERFRGALEKNNYSDGLKFLYGDNIIYQHQARDLENILDLLGYRDSLGLWAKEIINHNDNVIINHDGVGTLSDAMVEKLTKGNEDEKLQLIKYLCDGDQCDDIRTEFLKYSLGVDSFDEEWLPLIERYNQSLDTNNNANNSGTHGGDGRGDARSVVSQEDGLTLSESGQVPRGIVQDNEMDEGLARLGETFGGKPCHNVEGYLERCKDNGMPQEARDQLRFELNKYNETFNTNGGDGRGDARSVVAEKNTPGTPSKPMGVNPDGVMERLPSVGTEGTESSASRPRQGSHAESVSGSGELPQPNGSGVVSSEGGGVQPLQGQESDVVSSHRGGSAQNRVSDVQTEKMNANALGKAVKNDKLSGQLNPRFDNVKGEGSLKGLFPDEVKTFKAQWSKGDLWKGGVDQGDWGKIKGQVQSEPWYINPLWPMVSTAMLMFLVDQLNGDIWDSFANYPFTGVELDAGADRWGEVVGHLQAVGVDSLQWSGSAAKKFAAQVKMLRDQIDPLAGVDTQFRSSMQDHAKQVMGFHITMWVLLDLIAAATTYMAMRVYQPKYEEFKSLAHGAGYPAVAAEFFARRMAYQYTLPKQVGVCLIFVGATIAAQSWVWASCGKRTRQCDRAVAQYEQAAGATGFSQGGSVDAVVDSSGSWATRVGGFGWGGGQGSASSSLVPALPVQRGPVAGLSRSGGGYSSSRPADAPIPVGVGNTNASLLAQILGGLPSAPTGSGAKVSAPSGVDGSSFVVGPRPTPSRGGVSAPSSVQPGSGSTPPPPLPRAPMAPPPAPVKKADAAPSAAGQRAPVAPKTENPGTGLDRDQDADRNPEYDPTTGLLIG